MAAIAIPLVAAGATTQWALATSPNPGTSINALNGVACPDASHCWAVGVTSSGTSQSLIERWNGSAWSVATSGNENGPSTLWENVLNGISCTSTANCWAVGDFFVPSSVGPGFWEPLWEHWNGSTWTASTFVVGVATSYWLNGVSCVDASHCWAVGYKNGGAGDSVWIQQWNGSFWQNDAITQAGVLRGVSCVDSSHCWAAGYASGAPDTALIEKWNGTSWSAATTANRGSNSNLLQGVSCVSTTYCWAVGYYYDGSRWQNVFQKWNGTAWAIAITNTTTSNNDTPSENSNFLRGVTCQSTTYCWSVGDYFPAASGSRTLIDSWDGTTWSLVSGTPNRGTASQADMLNGVACADTGHCAAVGEYGTVVDPTLILQFIAAPVATPIPVPATGGAGSPGVDTGAPPAGLLIGGGLVLLLLGGGVMYGGNRRRRQY